MKCTRCDGEGFLNIGQVPADVLGRGHDAILSWPRQTKVLHDVQVCDCCGDGEQWYGEPGWHYGEDDPHGQDGPYAYNCGVASCH